METITHRIARILAALEPGADAGELEAWLERPAEPEHGDLSLPCFKLSKRLRRSPQAIAEDWAERLQDDAVAEARAVSGYLNLSMNRAWVAEQTLAALERQGEAYGSSDRGAGRTVVIDYSSPNIAKPFHIAHLRSTVIGQSLRRILSFSGYRCIGVNHLGDWGTQFGKLLTAYRHWGDEALVERDGIDELLRLYVRFHDEAEARPELEDEARGWFARLEQGDPEAAERWARFVEISLAHFNRVYERLGVSFDAYTGESFYNDKMPAVLEELRAKGLLEEDDGAQVVRLDDYGMPPALILKQDGSSLYPTRDIAAALYRKTHYAASRILYVTDYAQQLHFKQWFAVIERMGYPWASALEHVPFGRVSFGGEGLSTRKGNVVKLEEVLEQAVQKTEAIMRDKVRDSRARAEVARAVGVGAVIFHDLSRHRLHDVSFEWSQVLNFDGETGPYVQYTHARACRLLARASAAPQPDNPAAAGGALQLVDDSVVADGWTEQFNEDSLVVDGGVEQFDEDSLVAAGGAEHLTDDAAWPLVQALHRFPERVEQAERSLEPSVISKTLIELAQAFNRFYHHCPVLTEAPAVREARLRLVGATAQTLRTGLYLIGLEAPQSI
ncbi:arginine--tRNA ligase [Paenibacillus sp. 598K]|uniref:arginine--tRNA ligase n=1 Tax=Paenibacillus sp. 598K TaxID=1117987 RepID=UPI000FF940AA|nr:arginine--tRNA ligase [Paenibacillus sp. 598K]GBF72108.1 arginine--tRNA ligase [Paenibacillus sp. 598K]